MLRNLLFVLLCMRLTAVFAAAPVILVLGDSLSAGYGIDVRDGWVALLQDRLAAQGYPHRIVNASISGDTSRGGLSRLPKLLRDERPAVAIVELGGNDGLRGLALEELRYNLNAIVGTLCEHGSRVMLVPMKIPPNYGPVYTQGFEQIYRDVAASHGVLLGSFILEDIALQPELMQDDGIHPTAAAQPLIVDRLWPLLQRLLDVRHREAAR